MKPVSGVLLALCAAGVCLGHAQELRSADGVRTVMKTILRHEARGEDHLQFAPDSAVAWRDFVRCRNLNGRLVCSLVGGKPVTVIEVRMTTPNTADVMVRYFRMADRMCPGGDRIDPPVIDTSDVGAEW